MIRLGLYGVAASLLLQGAGLAESIPLTRNYNGDEQHTYSFAKTTAVGGAPDQNSASDDDFQTARSTASASSAGGANVGHSLEVSDAVCNTAPNASSFAPSIQIISGGPLIVTNSATAQLTGEAASAASFVVGTPVNPYTTMVMSGTITIANQPGARVPMYSTTIQVGGSIIQCSNFGYSGIIKDISKPGGQYTIGGSGPLSGTWNISEYTGAGATIAMDAISHYDAYSATGCSEYPDFSLTGEISVDAF